MKKSNYLNLFPLLLLTLGLAKPQEDRNRIETELEPIIQMEKVKEAIKIFKLNIEIHPQYANGYDSLGEAYMIDGNKALAIKNYKKALELTPNTQSAIEALKKLRKE